MFLKAPRTAVQFVEKSEQKTMRTAGAKCKRWDFCREHHRGSPTELFRTVADPRSDSNLRIMPELPEVEVLRRRLDPRLRGRMIEAVQVHRSGSIRPQSSQDLTHRCRGDRLGPVTRRSKTLLIALADRSGAPHGFLQIHLGMTGRLSVVGPDQATPTHPAVTLSLGDDRLEFSDLRGLGRFGWVPEPPQGLGPEPLDPGFTVDTLALALGNHRQPIKVRLMEPSCVSGIGNIYAAEILFRARIHPARPSRELSTGELRRLHAAIRSVLSEAIDAGLGATTSDDPAEWTLFHREVGGTARGEAEHGFAVYDREGEPCPRCGRAVQRIRQASRSTYLCPGCQSRES
jgi:formamidopyrimidine-DNA glycosylase